LSNPGSAGGPVIIGDGKLVGIVGKEVRSAELAIWINYVIPVQNIRSVLEAVLEGRAETNPKPPRTQEPNRRQLAGVDLRGIRLLPEVLDRTPPFVDGVEIDSPAELAGLRPDDLVVYIGETLVEDTADLRAALLEVSTDAPIKVVVLRNEELLALELTASNPSTEEPAP
jgi:serine protease Do